MKLFGTDGVRGKFGVEPITPQTVQKLGWALGTVVREKFKHPGEIIIGKDTRVSGYILEYALTGGLLSTGVDIVFLGPVPTPAVSWFCRNTGAVAGIVISASHNDAADNGIKLFHSDGSKLPSSIENRIEEKMTRPMSVVMAEDLGKARRIDDSADQYVQHLCSNAKVNLDGLRIVVDCANGASYRIAPSVLTELGAEVVAVADQPDGFNINRGCGSTNPDFIKSSTASESANVGIALDGDGDRVVMVDETGDLVNGDQILYAIAMARKQAGRLRGGVVGTHLSNLGLEKALSNTGIPFERVDVGDRFISKRLKELNWNLGGEECGHILNGEAGVPGDGLVAALEVLSEMVKTGKTLRELVQGVTLVPQETRNVKFMNGIRPLRDLNLDKWPRTKESQHRAAAELAASGRVYLRSSGTEPAIRILVEGENKDQISRIASHLAEVVREESGVVKMPD